MSTHIISEEENSRIKPFELSLWRDELVTRNFDSENQEGETKFLDIYRGIGTDKNDLSFWFRPRVENGGRIVSNNGNKSVATIQFDEPDTRKKDLVHIDFSTSNLNFKPNTYYTFYTKINFTKFPDLTKYKKNTDKIEHILLSLVCNNVEDSIWDMPHPIFDTKLGIKAEINSKNKTTLLLVNNSLQDGEQCVLYQDSANEYIYYLLGRLKTNNFIEKGYTLGMWSYVETWLGDYWTGDIEIHVIEDNESCEQEQEKYRYDILNDLFLNPSPKLSRGIEEPVGAPSNESGEEVGASNNNGIDFIIEALQYDFYEPETLSGEIKPPFTENGYYKDIITSTETILEEYLIDMEEAIKEYLEQPSDTTIINNFCLQEGDVSQSNRLQTVEINIQEVFINFLNPDRVEDFLQNLSFQLDTGIYPYLQKEDNNNYYFYVENNKFYKFTKNDEIIEIKNENNQNISQEDFLDNFYSQSFYNRLVEDYWKKFFQQDNDLNLKNIFLKEIKISLTPTGPINLNQESPNSALLSYSAIKKWNNLGRILLNNNILRQYYYDLYLEDTSDVKKNNKRKNYRAETRITNTTKGYALQLAIIVPFLGVRGEDIREVPVNSNYDSFSLYLRRITNDKGFPKEAKLRKWVSLDNYQNDFVKLQAFNFKYEDNIIKQKSLLEEPSFTPFKNQEKYLKEKKYLIFGAKGGPKSYAQDIVLTQSTKDAMNTLTFSMYNNYYTEFGEKEQNPYINLLKNESKIKLNYEDKWYDFIITDVDLDSEENKIVYTAKDANVIELSKIGFNKEFNTELDNNVGTINELTERVLQGTDWSLDADKTEKFIQYALKPVFGGYLKEGCTITIDPKEYFYDDKLVMSQRASNLEPIEIKLLEGSFIYMFYDSASNEKPAILCPCWDTEYRSGSIETTIAKEQYLKIDNKLTNIFICPVYTIESEVNSRYNYPIEGFEQVKIETLEIFDEKLYFDYTLRAKDIVIKSKTHYSPSLKRYVTEYKDVKNSSENESKILYGYVESEYSTKPLVQNLLSNGKNFTSLDGWYLGALNNKFHINGSLGCGKREEEDSFVPYLYFSTDTRGIETDGTYDGIGGKTLKNKYPHGFICNTALGYNFSALDHLAPGDEFVLQMQIERGRNLISGANENVPDDLLYFAETIVPSLYFYDGTYTFEKENSENILPNKKDQVVHFIQDKRFIDMSKYKSGLIKSETWGNPGTTNSTSTFADLDSNDEVIYNLKMLVNKGRLVPIYYYHSQNKNDVHYKTIDKYPLAFVTFERAERWRNRKEPLKPLVKTFEEVGLNVQNINLKEGDTVSTNTGLQDYRARDYVITEQGWKEFRKLFVILDEIELEENESQNSAMNLKDFAIIGIPAKTTSTIDNNSDSIWKRTMTQLKGIDPNSNYGSGPINYCINHLAAGSAKDRRINYYLPMLFSDDDLIKEDSALNKNSLCKTFFRSEEFEEVLKSKEYYTLSTDPGKVTPYNLKLDDNSSEVIDYEDFLQIIRMREYWYLKRYSEDDTCIFETTGIFYGKPIRNKEDNGQIKWDYSNERVGYNYNDLIEKNLGLFLLSGFSRIDNNSRGGDDSQSITISELSLFRKYQDLDGNLLQPDEIIDSNTTPIYKLYDPDINTDVVLPENMQYSFVGSSLKNTEYEIILDKTGERKNSITMTESNCLNLLQKIAEIFEGWLIVDVKHNELGEILFDENDKPRKQVYFVNANYNNNYSGIKYGVNLKKIQRKLDSNDIVTKLIVKNNGNEFAENKFCSIARSAYNLNGSNSIYNFNYLIQNGLLPTSIKKSYFQDVCPRAINYGRLLINLNTERTLQLTKKIQIEAKKEYYKNLINTSKQKLAENFQEFNSYKNIIVQDKHIRNYSYYLQKSKEFERLPDGLKTVITSLNFYNNLIEGFEKEYKKAASEFTTAIRKYNSYIDVAKGLTFQRDYLLKKFEELCRGYIREGAWSSEDYIDDDLYYLDGERQAEEVSKPKVSYTIEIVDISSLPNCENYNYKLRDKTFVEDPEVFGYDMEGRPFKEEIIVTEKASYLQSPDKNTITVQNYRTSFDDLFQRMASTIQAVEFGTLNYPNKDSSRDLEARISNNEATTITLKAINGIY